MKNSCMKSLNIWFKTCFNDDFVYLTESKDIISLPETAEGGIDTILCLDLSASVEGKAFEQLKSVLIEYLTGTK